ncbi:MAG: hypothetical protein OXI87_14300 [Albidovulum sp.]|nr:hypothetical protein [Albidovulum sp.]
MEGILSATLVLLVSKCTAPVATTLFIWNLNEDAVQQGMREFMLRAGR